MQGTRDSLLLKQDHGYFIYEIWRCSDKATLTDLETEIQCAPDTLMKLKSDPNAASVDKSTISQADLDANLYEEDLEGDSIDNFLRTKVVAMKLIN